MYSNIKLYRRIKQLKYPVRYIQVMTKFQLTEQTAKSFLTKCEDRGLLDRTEKYWFPTRKLINIWEDI